MDVSLCLHVLINLKQTAFRADIITLLSPSYAWIRGRLRNKQASNVSLEKQIREGDRSGS